MDDLWLVLSLKTRSLDFLPQSEFNFQRKMKSSASLIILLVTLVITFGSPLSQGNSIGIITLEAKKIPSTEAVKVQGNGQILLSEKESDSQTVHTGFVFIPIGTAVNVMGSFDIRFEDFTTNFSLIVVT